MLERKCIYVVDYGTNVGKEFKDLHLGLVIQNDTGNAFSDTVIVLPITDYKCDEKFDNNVHHKIYNSYFEFVDRHGLDKNPSKVKIADVTTVDKSRIGARVGKLDSKTYELIIKKFRKVVNIS
nr:type II toxin-antitoxin system PemK/MazF family toxin [Clostridium sp. WB02_MRS01]